jgi:hypothetical protein
MKVLYAAGNRLGSFFQLKRFLESIQCKNYDIKIAAYKISMGNIDVDYTLDALLNIANPNNISFNGNFTYYANEIKRFSPDLIISDFDIYTSLIALDLNIKLWQYSPIILYYALKYEIKYNSKLHKTYWHLLDSTPPKNNYIQSIINNSDRRYVVSHICDSAYKNIITENFEWVRPNFILDNGINSVEYMFLNPIMNKNELEKFGGQKAVITLFPNDISKNTNMINIYSQIYNGYLANCKFCVSDGTLAFLADAFYNQKYCKIYPRYNDIECIISGLINDYCGFGCLNSNNDKKISNIDVIINHNVKFISEHLEQL